MRSDIGGGGVFYNVTLQNSAQFNMSRRGDQADLIRAGCANVLM